MACLQALKQDIKILEQTFNRENERFRILSSSVDELCCQFVGVDGENYNIHANITVRAIYLFVICSLFMYSVLWFYLKFIMGAECCVILVKFDRIRKEYKLLFLATVIILCLYLMLKYQKVFHSETAVLGQNLA
jgi:hypothetical protein